MALTPQPTGTSVSSGSIRCSGAAASRRRSLTPSVPSKLTLPELHGGSSGGSGNGKFLLPVAQRTSSITPNPSQRSHSSTHVIGAGARGSTSTVHMPPTHNTSPVKHQQQQQQQALQASLSSSSSLINQQLQSCGNAFLDTSLGSFGVSVSLCSTPSSFSQHHRRSNGATPTPILSSSTPPSAAVAAAMLDEAAMLSEFIDYTRLVCPVKLQEVTAKARNVSPFDSQKYYALLPPPTSAHSSRVALALDIDETLVHAVSVPAATTNGGRQGTVLRFSADHTRSVFNNNPTTPSSVHHAAAAGAAALPVAGVDTAALLQRFRANSDFVVHIAKGAPNEEMVFVKYRPHVHEFLSFATRHFEVIFFTASRACYADPLLDELLAATAKLATAGAKDGPPPPPPVQRLRLYREHCAEVGPSKVKDLSLLGRPLHRIALVDNLASSFMFQPRNGVHIKSWYGEPHDTELRTMQHMLGHLAAASDVVTVLDKYNSALLSSVPTSPARTPIPSSRIG